MPSMYPIRRFTPLLIVAAAALASAFPAIAQTQQRVAGDVVALTGTTLELRSKLGQDVALKVPDTVRVTLRVPATWADIATGSYVGTTAVPSADGTLLAKEVHIFADNQRGTGEGHYPMATPGDTMTNATVSSMSGSRPRDTMTNATVAATGAGSGDTHRLTLTYKGGEQTVTVPASTPILRSEPADRKALVPGAHVVAYAHRDADGSLALERVSVGKDGFDPPI